MSNEAIKEEAPEIDIRAAILNIHEFNRGSVKALELMNKKLEELEARLARAEAVAGHAADAASCLANGIQPD